jgi:hypothetical protein
MVTTALHADQICGTSIANYLSVPPIRTSKPLTGRRILMKVKVNFLFVLAACFIMIFPALSNATPVLRLTTGSTTIEIADGSAGDANPMSGIVTYIGAVGSEWTINVTTGQTGIGSITEPVFDLNSVDSSYTANISVAPSNLIIMLSDAGFLGEDRSRVFDSHIGGTTQGTLTYSTYYGEGLFDLSNQIATTTFAPISFSNSTTMIGNPSDSFSMTQVVTISHKGGSQISSFNGMLSDDMNPVPEPSSLLLLGSGLLATCFFFRRRTI